MRRAVAIVALVALLAGCSSGGSGPEEPERVDYRVTLEGTLIGAATDYGMIVEWGYLHGEPRKEETTLAAWKKEFVLTWPDELSSYVKVRADPYRPGMAAIANTPRARCKISVNGKLIETYTAMIPLCNADMSATTPPTPMATATAG